jgi:hypothetical protein
MSGRYPFHPLAARFPLLPTWSGAFKALVEHIRKHGLLVAIVLLDNMILDGRNREEACVRCRVEPHFRLFGSDPKDGNDPAAFVQGVNQHRRHLAHGQRVFLAEAAVDWTWGGDRQSSDQEPALALGLTLDEAAAEYAVSKSSIKVFHSAYADAVPEAAEAAFEGRFNVSRFAQVAKLPEEMQRKASFNWKKFLEEHPEYLPKKRGVKTKWEVAAAAFDDLSGEEKFRHRDMADDWCREHPGERGGAHERACLRDSCRFGQTGF